VGVIAVAVTAIETMIDSSAVPWRACRGVSIPHSFERRALAEIGGGV
jgi:hypothetical protein